MQFFVAPIAAIAPSRLGSGVGISASLKLSPLSFIRNVYSAPVICERKAARRGAAQINQERI